MIGIVDYGAGNLKSVENALQHLGAAWKLVHTPADMASVSGLILPGVGSFGDAMEQLERQGLCQALREYTAVGRPFLGICLGLQLLFEYSEESPGVQGLGIFRGGFHRIPAEGLKVPQIGWNSLEIRRPDSIFAAVPDGTFAYFVHSYYLNATDREEVAATCRYGVSIDAAVERGRVSACQFHPEKSGEAGGKILAAFLARCDAYAKEAGLC